MFVGCKNTPSKLFTKLDKTETGIDFRNILEESPEMNVLNYSYFYNGGGVAIGDINNDGLQDILFTGNMVKNRLYLNKGDFKFEDITVKSGIADNQGWCTGATMVDINGDGKLDIYICRSADGDPARRKNLLFINNGDLTFTEEAEKFGLADKGYSTQASFFDYDKDGDLDMFLINHSLQKYSTGVQQNADLRNIKNPDFAIKLYQNNNGHFKDVSSEAGITSNVLSFGLGVAISDINSDGWPDVYVSNDFNEPDYLFINNGNGTFTDKLAESMDQVSLYSMGSDVADYNNDALPDLMTLDMLPEGNKAQKMHSGAENFDKMQFLFQKGFYYQFSRNMLQKNNGDGTFSEIGQLAGVSNTDWSWAVLFSDFDNDGNKDLFVSNGYVKDYTDMDFLKFTMDKIIRARQGNQNVTVTDFIEKMPSNNISNYVFQNMKNDRFERRNKTWGLDEEGVSAGAAYVDLNNDGYMDLVVNNTNDFAAIYRNNGKQTIKNNYIRIKLIGDPQNERGIGTKVTVYCKNNKYFQEEMPVRGFQSSVDPVLNFGLGKDTVIDSIVVIWPDNKSQKLPNIKVNQTLIANTRDAINSDLGQKVIPRKYFTNTSAINFSHKENEFNDFNVQSLMPNYLSRQGPCMAKADINGDGRQDLFIGGAKGELGKLFIQDAEGKFFNKVSKDIAADSLSEDVAAEFFDANGDGKMDLYVGSGGYEFAENDPLLQDRLYINDGKGNFSKKKVGLPQMLISTGCVKAADIDGDGDMDLFVGGRLVPGKYPVAPMSKILLNDGKGNFRDATTTEAPVLERIGMVTDAIWMDMNKDGQPDLIIAGEWMPIKVFINQKGKLTDASSEYIKFNSTGWWNKILAEDMDGDGDKDLIIGNCGLNTQFKCSNKEPMTMYFKDFSGNGSINPILCYYIDSMSYPAASLDDLTGQIPALKKKFLEYKDYATATIHDIFTPDQLSNAGVLKAEMMQTVYLENQGSKGFLLHPLPLEAQFAPVYAITSLDVDKDNKKDLVIAGCNSWTRIKFGQLTANHGMLLSGDGKGNFKYIPQWKSGLNIRGNVRSMELVPGNKGVQLFFGVNNSSVKSVKLE